MSTPAESQTDGRIQRSERSREAIVQAMVDLIGEGILAPTAQQVAERAEVGVRTVFRHFSDMDTLFATIHERVMESVSDLFITQPQEGPLGDRLDRLVDRRTELLARVAPYFRSGADQRSRSTFLQKQHDRGIRGFRDDLRLWLPELENAPAETANALELVLSQEAYDRLRTGQKLSAARTRETIRVLVHGIASGLQAT